MKKIYKIIKEKKIFVVVFMKYLKVYKKLGLNTEKEVFDYLINHLDESIFTWSYFVDFKKIKNKIKKFEVELNILNVLIGKKGIEKEFLNLIEKYPKVRRVLPLLIALRNEKLKKIKVITDIKSLDKKYTYKLFDPKIPLNEEIKKELLNFFIYSGLKEIFKDKNIKSVVDYSFGIETGLDTNARKNRSGKEMETLVEKILEKLLENNDNFEFISQATKDKIKEKWNYEIKIEKTNKKFDFAVFNKKERKLFLIETNYYGTKGSKLKSTAGEYKNVYDTLKKQNIVYIWITDGVGWKETKRALYETFLHTDHVINLDLIKHGALKEILKL